jgi:acetylornithine deacetylase
MQLVSLTRQLVDIPSVSGNEGEVGNFLFEKLGALGYEVRRIVVDGERANLYATWPEAPDPAIVFSTHMDTVPPFIQSSEDNTHIYGRGSCDAKGIMAAQIAAAGELKRDGIHVGLLFLVGEERDSLGAKIANREPNRCRFLINGEPTENRMAIASKGALRVELWAHGRMAHSAYPELGESAIDKLIEALGHLRAMKLASDPELGPCTMNIGHIEGGRAPNVIADEARALLLYRLIGESTELRAAIREAVGGLAEVDFTLEIPFVRLRTLPGFSTMMAAFTSDVPALSAWGQPLLVGPGSIHVAHTEREYVEKRQLDEAVGLYCRIARELAAEKGEHARLVAR